MRVCLGFAHGAEISAGRSPLTAEDLLWGKLGLLSLKPQVVAGSVLHDMTVLYGLFGSSVMGLFTAWLLQRMLCCAAICSSFHLRLEKSLCGWKI